MTVRRKPTGEFEKLLTKGDISWRTIVIILILSMHPWGQAVLMNWGFPTPKTGNSEPMEDMRKDLVVVKKDLDVIKADVLELRVKATKLDTALTGFQIDFNKHRPQLASP